MRRNERCQSFKHQSQGQRIKKRHQGIVCSCSSPRTLMNQHCMLKCQHQRDQGFKRSREHSELGGRMNVTTLSSTKHQVSFLKLTRTFFEGINWRKGKGLKDLVNYQHCILIEKTSNFFKTISFMCFSFKTLPWAFGFRFEIIGIIIQLVYCLLHYNKMCP